MLLIELSGLTTHREQYLLFRWTDSIQDSNNPPATASHLRRDFLSCGVIDLVGSPENHLPHHIPHKIQNDKDITKHENDAEQVSGKLRDVVEHVEHRNVKRPTGGIQRGPLQHVHLPQLIRIVYDLQHHGEDDHAKRHQYLDLQPNGRQEDDDGDDEEFSKHDDALPEVELVLIFLVQETVRDEEQGVLQLVFVFSEEFPGQHRNTNRE